MIKYEMGNVRGWQRKREREVGKWRNRLSDAGLEEVVEFGAWRRQEGEV